MATAGAWPSDGAGRVQPPGVLMKKQARPPATIARGDFQTPVGLASSVCKFLAKRGVHPAAILEPTCGRGAFLLAAMAAFPSVETVVGVEIDRAHLLEASARTSRHHPGLVSVVRGDFFTFDWPVLLGRLPDPLLILGNPPWVTTSNLGALRSANRPARHNRTGLHGIDAITGRANFDISLWMIERCLEWLADRHGTLAMLCKFSVARKALAHAWRRTLPVADARVYRIDARRHFGACVDACLLEVCIGRRGREVCTIYPSLQAADPGGTFGMVDGVLVADAEAYTKTRHLVRSPAAPVSHHRRSGARCWRSGVKHDCARVMELTRRHGRYWNGLGESVDIEDAHCLPLVKGADLASGRLTASNRHLVVPQAHPGEDTARLSRDAPRTWAYLVAHASLLDQRASRIYHGKARFSIFGIGPYSFSPWKVAVSALHRTPEFRIVGPEQGKPVLFDDTCYFVPCATREEAEALAAFLHTEDVRLFLRSRMFPGEKRPITARLLNQIDLDRGVTLRPGADFVERERPRRSQYAPGSSGNRSRADPFARKSPVED